MESEGRVGGAGTRASRAARPPAPAGLSACIIYGDARRADVAAPSMPRQPGACAACEMRRRRARAKLAGGQHRDRQREPIREAAMIKVIACINRKPGMEVDAFQAHWLNRHPEVVLQLPGLRRYVQSHVRPSGYRGGRALVHDGIAELWFDDLATLKAANDGPAIAAVMADEARFIDPARRVMLLCDEHVIVDRPPPAGAIKNVEFVHRRPGMAVDAFQRYWRDVHGPLAARIPSVRRYVQSHVRPGGYRDGRQPAYDGVAVTWFDSTDAMRQGATTAAYAATRADEPSFIDTADLPIILTTEHVILG
jgi:uncharacterized protein (TIGR02118 family)